MGGEQDTLGEVASAFRKRFRKAIAPLTRASKALDALVAPGGAAKLTLVGQALRALDGLDLSAHGMAEEHAALVARLAATNTRMITAARTSLLGELRQRAGREGMELVHLSDRPLTVLLAPLTVELDLLADVAVLHYAREAVVEVRPTAGAILEAHAKAVDGIRSRAVTSEVFFERLVAAYRLALGARGQADGERVDLVDLLLPLALLEHDVGVWRTGRPDKVEPYPRYLLAYQLNRLRRDGLLALRGRRVELGTATGGSTRNKRDVLFIPTSPAEGQYHLSVRVSAFREEGA